LLEMAQAILGTLNSWKEFDLEAKKKQILSQAATITENREQNQPARTLIQEETKKFRPLTPEQKVAQMPALIKLYQKEIDRLTTNAKFSGDSYLALYNDLANLVDPVESLKAAHQFYTERANDHKIKLENEKLKKELEGYKTEFQEMQNQEITIRKLKESIEDYKQNIHNLVQEAVNKREIQLKDELQTQVDQLQAQTEGWKATILQYRTEHEEVQSLNAVLRTQLQDQKRKYEAEILAKQAEVDMLTNEVERTNQQYQLLKNESASQAQASRSKEGPTKSDLELTLVQKDIEIAMLNNKNGQLLEKDVTSQKQIQELTLSEEKNKKEIKSLQTQLEAAPKVERVRRLEKRITKLKEIIGQRESIVWSASEGEEAHVRERNVSSSTVSDSDDRPGSTSSLLMKTRQLENDLVQSKATMTKMVLELKQSEERYKSAQQDIERKQQQLHQWELDFEQMRSLTQMSGSAGVASAAGSPTDAQNQPMLEMIWHQRDSFKEKIQQLEQTNAQLQATIQNQLIDVKRTKADNIKLYEKIKYLETYAGTHQKSSSALDIEKGRVIESRYQEIYDENSNPFIEFLKKEKLNKIQELNPVEKLVLSLSKFFLATKGARWGLFCYLMILHSLVFLSLGGWVHS